MRKVIKESGYAQEAADHPSRVLDTRSFEQLLEEELPNDSLVRQLYKNSKSTGGHVSNEAIRISFQIKGRLINKNINTDEDLNKPISQLLAEIEELRKKLPDRPKEQVPEK